MLKARTLVSVMRNYMKFINNSMLSLFVTNCMSFVAISIARWVQGTSYFTQYNVYPLVGINYIQVCAISFQDLIDT